MQYTVINFSIAPAPFVEIMIAELSAIGFDSFEELPDTLQAYIPSETLNEDAVQALVTRYADFASVVVNSVQVMPNKNWNELWESNFKPLIVNEQILIKASFHTLEKQYPYTILIDPKMAFGTGHHETTYLVLQEMLRLQEYFNAAQVLDFGCGTGILGIMASLLAAKHITAIDNDKWAYDNVRENITINAIENMTTLLGDHTVIPSQKFALILANVNYMAIVATMDSLVNHMQENAYILFSGILQKDSNDIEQMAIKRGLVLQNKTLKGNWTMLCYQKNKG